MTETTDLSRAVRTLVVGAGALVLAWALLGPLTGHAAIFFCATLLALAVSRGAAFLERRARIPYPAAVAMIAIATLTGIVAFGAWTGPRLAREFVELAGAVEDGIDRARSLLARSELGRAAQEQIEDAVEPGAGGTDLGPLSRWIGQGVATGLGAFADLALVLFLGFFFAASPERYIGGALLLVPRARRERLREVLSAIGCALAAWIRARLILMVVLGTAFGIGLALLGVPLALPIGVLTGILSFIPYVGAVLAVVPAVAVALVQSPELALQVLVLYLAIQAIETHVVDPLVEAHAVRLPPATIAIAQVLAAVWFGPVGLLIATPLLVVIVVATRMLWIEDRLGEPISDLPGGARPRGCEPAPGAGEHPPSLNGAARARQG